MNELGPAFIARSRYHLSEDFLPKIERCLELITDEQMWWRANEQSNSIGNLLLHLSGNVRLKLSNFPSPNGDSLISLVLIGPSSNGSPL